MHQSFKPEHVCSIDSLQKAVEEQWIVAGLSGCPERDRVLKSAARILKRAKQTPALINTASKTLALNQQSQAKNNSDAKQNAIKRAATVKIYRAEYQRFSKKMPSTVKQGIGKEDLVDARAWASTQSRLFKQFGTKAPDDWRFEMTFTTPQSSRD
jgi:hypothetical protein